MAVLAAGSTLVGLRGPPSLILGKIAVFETLLPWPISGFHHHGPTASEAERPSIATEGHNRVESTPP